ncbi:hypothetical protein [Pseudovibrio sp. Tun.PSC04-5.I4]|uniref:hypothetical protein n=1 Tax=Pseudovibrio sp. Tun.PSC04-5.I4 TaxID=1798213 RepID=UPI00088E9395|nr:hypothetical protein [Pseudovibrio sp. Tun.PSC04-5.I4]SDR12023.1 hypothetical protein SAMN04515695_2871 [Pseudovibrio sp. Tun.PSC04-5.I4]
MLDLWKKHVKRPLKKRRLERGRARLEQQYEKIGDPKSYPVGSRGWLAATEKKYGGLVQGVKRRAYSAFDSRSEAMLKTGGMQGGDRMHHHGYGADYEHFLKAFIRRRFEECAIVEVGILRGTGLALWRDMFPNSDVLGLDIDLSNYNAHLPKMLGLGAFANGAAETHIFDQFVDGKERLSEILNGRKISIAVDDGVHFEKTIFKTAEGMKPFLAEEFVYFVEDNGAVVEGLRNIFPDADVFSRGELTVICRN